MSNLTNLKEVTYLNRDYLSFKSQLMSFVQRYFPNDWKDFSENSSGMSILEMVAYIGDILSFYQDHQFNEIFLEAATEFKNIVASSKNIGYNPKGKKPSYAKVDITAIFDSASSRSTYGFVLKKESQISTKINPPVVFETLSDIDFSKDDDNTTATISAGNYYVTKSNVDVVSGVTKTFQTYISSPKKFLKITIPDKNIFNIVSIIDSNGNNYYEVKSLSQDQIMTSIPNLDSSSANIENNLKLRFVPRRFISNIDGEGYTTITFGSGIQSVEDFEFIPSPEDYTINQTLVGRKDIPIETIALENFLTTNSLGHAPFNTTLTIKYTSGGGPETAVAANTINKILKTKFSAKNPIYQNDSNLSRILNSLLINNNEPASGGGDADQKEDIKYIAPKYFAAQGRAISLPDFIAIAKSMPSKFGSIYRCSAKVDPLVNNTINLYVLTKQEANGIKNFDYPNQKIIDNLKQYFTPYRAYNDIISIRSAKIINIGIDFNIRIDHQIGNASEILANAMFALKNYFDIKNWDIEQPIYLSKVTNVITNVKGVLAAYNVLINQKPESYDGRNYETVREFNLNSNMKNGAILCPPNCCFEVKFPLFDITGSYIVEN